MFFFFKHSRISDPLGSNPDLSRVAPSKLGSDPRSEKFGLDLPWVGSGPKLPCLAFVIEFGVRRDLKVNNGDGVALKHKCICWKEREGPKNLWNWEWRCKEPRDITQVNSRVAIRVWPYLSLMTYIISAFRVDYNHALIDLYQLHLIPLNMQVSKSFIVIAVSLQRICVKTSCIIDLFVAQRGGYKNVKFTHKHLQNKLNK